MKITESNKGPISIFQIEGRLDSNSSGQLEKALVACLEGQHNLLLDFSNLDYVSSAGLRVLLMAAKKAKAAGGKLVLTALSLNVYEVFDIAGFTSIFPIEASLEEGLRSF